MKGRQADKAPAVETCEMAPSSVVANPANEEQDQAGEEGARVAELEAELEKAHADLELKREKPEKADNSGAARSASTE